MLPAKGKWVYFRSLMISDDATPLQIDDDKKVSELTLPESTSPDRLIERIEDKLPKGWTVSTFGPFALVRRTEQVALEQKIDPNALRAAKAVPADGIERSKRHFELLLKFDSKSRYNRILAQRASLPKDLTHEVTRTANYAIQMTRRVPGRAEFADEKVKAECDDVVKLVRNSLRK